MKNPILKVKNLCYTYGRGVTVLNGVNVEIYEGQKNSCCWREWFW